MTTQKTLTLDELEEKLTTAFEAARFQADYSKDGEIFKSVAQLGEAIIKTKRAKSEGLK